MKDRGWKGEGGIGRSKEGGKEEKKGKEKTRKGKCEEKNRPAPDAKIVKTGFHF